MVIWQDGGLPDCLGSGNAFAMGQPAPGGDGARSDRGESAEGAADHAERQEE